jgi:nicotinate-nucleotide adenylyltransferase
MSREGAVTVGVFGGAFDPPHLGHVALVRAAIPTFALDRLLVRVVAEPGHKEVATAAEARLALARLAFPDVEVSLDPHTRTIDSLEALGLPEPVFLVGADEFAAFLAWKEPQRILELARLGVATRPGFPHDRLEPVLAGLDRPDRVELFEIEAWPVASTDVRLRLSRGEPIDDLVPRSVADEIVRRRLYR